MKLPMTGEKQLTIQGPCGKIEALHSSHHTHSSLVMICHPHPLFQGTMWNKVVTQLTKSFIHLGFQTVRFNFRGVEGSEGTYGNVDGEVDDGKSVYDWCSQLASSIWCVGFSFGSYIAAHVASIHKQPCLMVAPPVMRFPFDGCHLANFCIIIQGDNDKIVNSDQVIDFAKQHHIPFKIIAGASHFFDRQLHELDQHVQDWIKQHL